MASVEASLFDFFLHAFPHLLNDYVLEELLIITFCVHKHALLLVERCPELLELVKHVPSSSSVILLGQRPFNLLDHVFKPLDVD